MRIPGVIFCKTADHAAVFNLPDARPILTNLSDHWHQSAFDQKYAQSLAKLPPVMRPSGQPTLQLALTTSQ